MNVKDLIEQVADGADPKELIESDTWKNEWSNDKVRVRWDNGFNFRDSAMIEELPGKPVKRKVRRMNVNCNWFSGPGGLDLFIIDNILRDVKFTKGSTYDNVVAQFKKAAEKAKKASIGKAARFVKGKEVIDDKWFSATGYPRSIFGEDTVSFLEVEPADYKPIQIKGKDFTMKCTWVEFETYDPSADFQSMDPSYTMYNSKSKASARKMFKLAKADDSILKSVSWGKLPDWLKKNKIAFEIHFSSWR